MTVGSISGFRVRKQCGTNIRFTGTKTINICTVARICDP